MKTPPRSWATEHGGGTQENGSILTALSIDHARYLDRRPYRRQLHAQLRELAERPANSVLGFVMEIQHEPDGTCCQSELWAATARRICRAVQDDGGPRSWFENWRP